MGPSHVVTHPLAECLNTRSLGTVAGRVWNPREPPVLDTDAAISPSPQPPPAVTRDVLIGHRFAGGGAGAQRGHGLAADLITDRREVGGVFVGEVSRIQTGRFHQPAHAGPFARTLVWASACPGGVLGGWEGGWVLERAFPFPTLCPVPGRVDSRQVRSGDGMHRCRGIARNGTRNLNGCSRWCRRCRLPGPPCPWPSRDRAP